jgi:predicted aspartyl protease/tetratricopeptide (TPR) repeat protein
VTIVRVFLAAAGLCAGATPALAENTCKLNRFAEMPVEMQDLRATVAVTINGTPTRLWLDSGAFFSILPKARAVELGLRSQDAPRTLRINGIGGSFFPEMTTVRDFGFLGTMMHNIAFLVGGSDSGNGFIGANVLGTWTTEFDLAKGKVALFEEKGCSRFSLAYWAAGMTVSEARMLSPEQPYDHHINLEVMINGRPVHAILDSGATRSSLTRNAARRVGIDLSAPDTVASGRFVGAGSESRQSWIARTRTIDIGGEQIANSPIRVIDDSRDGVPDMLLGIDFLLSHHVLVAQGQRKIYITYNGGPIFSAGTDDEIGHHNTHSENMGTAEQADGPKTADEFAGRGSARLTGGDKTGAIADFSEAIRLKPGSADLLGERAAAYLRAGKRNLALNDLDAALAIAPNDHTLLARRAAIRLAKGDRAGALADTDAAAAALPRGSLDTIPVVTLYERLGQADRGLALLDPVIALHRDDSAYAGLLNARAWNRALANTDLDRALKDANSALRKLGPEPLLLNTRALLQLRRKDYAAAIADASAALAKPPKLGTSLYVRGLAHIAGGDIAQGQADIAAARAIAPALDTYYAPYGLAAPNTAPAQSSQPDGDNDSEQ